MYAYVKASRIVSQSDRHVRKPKGTSAPFSWLDVRLRSARCGEAADKEFRRGDRSAIVSSRPRLSVATTTMLDMKSDGTGSRIFGKGNARSHEHHHYYCIFGNGRFSGCAAYD